VTRPRQMRLTERHVTLSKRDIPDPGHAVNLPPGFRPATDDDYAENVAAMLSTKPPGPLWLFGISSLIWKPETAFVEKRMGVARGWHRRFCLGWDYRFRGSKETPGLMMALDRGGTCKGMLYRLPDEGVEAELDKLIRREMSMVPSAFPWRFIDIATTEGPVRAMTFAMNRRSARYIAGLSEEELADILAKACGFRGSMAEYVFNTVSMLESLGIHDRNLWRMQKLVAQRIDAAYPADQQV
jgi:glutathione-specific gamma-glutamylcyclotransferase